MAIGKPLENVPTNTIVNAQWWFRANENGEVSLECIAAAAAVESYKKLKELDLEMGAINNRLERICTTLAKIERYLRGMQPEMEVDDATELEKRRSESMDRAAEAYRNAGGKILDLSIEDWNGPTISNRLYRALRRLNVSSLTDLADLTERDLSCLPQVGMMTVIEAKLLLESVGLKFTE